MRRWLTFVFFGIGLGFFACDPFGAESPSSSPTPKDGGADGEGGPGVATGTPVSDSGRDSEPSADGGQDGSVCAPGGGGGPTGGPADLFACNNPYDKDISALAASGASAGIIAACPTEGLRVDFSHHILRADGSTPTSSFTSIGLLSDADNVPVPIPSGGALADEPGYACSGTSSGECRLIVVNSGKKKLFEAYFANFDGAAWTADNLAMWDLSKPYNPLGRGKNCASSDAAGLPVAAGLIGVREAKVLAIRHALRITLPCVRDSSWVAPATHAAGGVANPSGPPFGTRLRLRTSFNTASLPSPGAKAVAEALKNYGAIVSGRSKLPLLWAESDRFPKSSDASLSWQALLSLNDLLSVLVSDFEVVDFGAVEPADTTCVRTP